MRHDIEPFGNVEIIESEDIPLGEIHALKRLVDGRFVTHAVMVNFKVPTAKPKPEPQPLKIGDWPWPTSSPR